MMLFMSTTFYILISHLIIHRKTRRASSCTFLKASVTVESALTIPIFFLAIVSMLYMMEVMTIRTNMKSALDCAAGSIRSESYTGIMFPSSKLEKDIVSAIGEERLNRSILVGGSHGVECTSSILSSISGIHSLKVKYQVKLPFPVFHSRPVPMEESICVKGWVGYSGKGFANQSKTVYVTENGSVYHLDYNCTYLHPKIRAVNYGTIPDLRNEDGGKYYPCEHCAKHETGGTVFITEFGTRYHTSLTCSDVKRTIYSIPIEEAVGKGVCSKCGK